MPTGLTTLDGHFFNGEVSSAVNVAWAVVKGLR